MATSAAYETTSERPARRVTLQGAFQKVKAGAAKDDVIQRVSGDHTAGLAKEKVSRKRKATRKVAAYEGTMNELRKMDTMGMDTLADAAKIAEMDEQLKNKPCYIIDPASTGMNVWDGVTALALIFTAIVTPFEVGFLPSTETPLDALFLINRLLDCIFVVDMVISSLLMYKVPQRTKAAKTLDAPKKKRVASVDEVSGHKAGGGYHQDEKPAAALTWEFRYRHVLYNYLTGWFLVDVLSVGPSAFDIYELATPPAAAANATASLLEVSSGDSIGSSNGTSLLDEAGGGGNLKVVKVLRVIRTLRLFKLLRLMRGSRMMKRWATRISVPFATIAITNLLLMVLYVTHFSGCMLGVMATFSEPNAKLDSWQGYYGYCGGGGNPAGARSTGVSIVSYDLSDGSGTFTCVGPFEMWLASIGWSISIIVTGGGDPQAGPYPGNESADPMSYLLGETISLTVLVLGMAALWSYVTAKFVDVISSSDPDATLWRNQIDDLNRFCTFHHLPDLLRRELREYAHERKEVLLAEQRKRVFADLSETLKETVAWQLNGDWLERIPVLQRLPEKFLVQVALNMSTAVYAPKEKPPAQRLYVIIKGFCTYGGQTLKQGEHWGQKDMAKTKQPMCATAITYLHVNYVATQTIFELADSYGDATILWAIKKWILFQKFREHACERLKLERKRKAWQKRLPDVPFPAELEPTALNSQNLTIENRVGNLTKDVDQIKQTLAALCAHMGMPPVSGDLSTRAGSSAPHDILRAAAHGTAPHRASIATRPPPLRPAVSAASAIGALRPLPLAPLPLPPVARRYAPQGEDTRVEPSHPARVPGTP